MMRINGINNVSNVYKSNKAGKAYGLSSTSSQKDTFAISDFAKELQVARQAVENAPDIRQDKVDEIKKQLEAGTYNVTAAMVADKLIEKYFG